MILDLPWPPSVNGYWRAIARRTPVAVRGGRVCQILSERGRKYREAAMVAYQEQRPHQRDRMPSGARLRCTLVLHAPTKRKYDLDNFAKGVLDSLQHAGVIEDDALIDRLLVLRGSVEKGGRVRVTLEAV